MHASGTRIVDGEGKELLLRGVNLGGWLLWESYLIKFPGKDLTESRMKRELVERHGKDAAYAFFRAYREHYVTRADLKRIRRLDWNVVRIPFNARILADEAHFDMAPGEGWALLDRALDWCEREGLYAVLDMHSAPGGQNGGGITDTELKRGLFAGDSVTRYRDEMAALWSRIAARYRDRTIVAAYDLLNEPAVPNEEGGGAAVAEVTRRMIAAVRAVDPRHLIMVEGNWYATDFSMFLPPAPGRTGAALSAAEGPDGNLCWQFHKYWNDTTPRSVRGFLELRERTRAPVWLGETGENSHAWYGACIRLMEAHGIGWCFWPWKRAGGGCVEAFEPPAEWTRTPAGLVAFAAALKLARCREDAETVRALRDGVASARAQPPAGSFVVEAEEFLPGEATGYHDSEAKNQGDASRKDEGVDVQATDEGGFGIGWITAGEWLTWRVEVPRAGTY
ncbi:MAG: cellulase family glycosylhydrolase, partial [bacterium]